MTGAATATLMVAGGVAINQVLDNGEWSLPWLLAALMVTLLTTLLTSRETGPDQEQEGNRLARAVPAPTRRLVALVGVVAVLTPPGVYAAHLFGTPRVEEWDDTRYPQEIKSIFDMPAPGQLLDPVFGQPKAAWTTAIKGGESHVVGGDSNIVVLRNGTHLFGLDMRTGAHHWLVDLHESTASCAVRENRIACVAPTGRDSAVFFLDAGSGQTRRTVKVPNRELRTMVLADDRFIAVTQWPASDRGFAAGYTTEGDQIWTREGNAGMYVSAQPGILVDAGSDVAVFVDTADGRELVRSVRPRWVGGRSLTWHVFRDGIAIQNKGWTGADIYDLHGEKKSSVAGWEPAGSSGPYGATPPVPLLARLGADGPHYPDRHTIAAANPATGHLLWRVSGPAISMDMATVGNHLIINVADPDAPLDAWGEPEITSRDFVRVYHCITGEALSPPIDMTRQSSVEPDWIESDGRSLVYSSIDDRPESRHTDHVVVSYDIESGGTRWELPLASRPAYVGGAVVAAGAPESISLFG
ncbi:PQQ-binding-like beta-propeller repeat protein [Micromonospora endolithica]|uniref:outer membrane protein assembly factor BamB family protein n=1 Tax=Micromonospora endolithica TaxID=230091 RepID=UPI0011BE744D|nr:PQQ-binding-like beta-propeller repeat protein [Micromonospora endolithica]